MPAYPRRIMVPLDGSPFAEQAVAPAAELAFRHGAALALTVVHPWGPLEDAPISGSTEDGELRRTEVAHLAKLLETITSAYRVPACTAVLDGPAGPALVDFARERGIDLVVACTHGRGALRRFVLGGVSHYLVQDLRSSVLLLRPQAAPDGLAPDAVFRRILVPLDGTVTAEAALDPAFALASSAGAVITLLHILTPVSDEGRLLQEDKAEASQYLATVSQGVREKWLRVESRVILRAEPGLAILEQAKEMGADLIALTTRRRGPVARALFGSVAETVVHRSEVPVLVCHAANRRETPALRREDLSCATELPA